LVAWEGGLGIIFFLCFFFFFLFPGASGPTASVFKPHKCTSLTPEGSKPNRPEVNHHHTRCRGAEWIIMIGIRLQSRVLIPLAPSVLLGTNESVPAGPMVVRMMYVAKLPDADTVRYPHQQPASDSRRDQDGPERVNGHKLMRDDRAAGREAPRTWLIRPDRQIDVVCPPGAGPGMISRRRRFSDLVPVSSCRSVTLSRTHRQKAVSLARPNAILRSFPGHE
jgi:hypothetical protein